MNEKNIIRRLDGRIEWLCEHGVGHTIFARDGLNYTHGCDGCCEKVSKIINSIRLVTIERNTKVNDYNRLIHDLIHEASLK